MTENQIKILLRVERATAKGKVSQPKTDSEVGSFGELKRMGYLTSHSAPLSGPLYRSIPEAFAQARLLGLLPPLSDKSRKPPVRLRNPRP